MEEVVASDILFKTAVAEAERQGRENFAKKFGITIIPRAPAPTITKVQVQVQPLKKQATLDRFMLDSMLIDASKTAAAKAAKAAKAATPKRVKKTAEVNISEKNGTGTPWTG
jgi:hypothetical protein